MKLTSLLTPFLLAGACWTASALPTRVPRSTSSSGSRSIADKIGCTACKGLGAVALGLVRLTGSSSVLRSKTKLFCPLVPVSKTVCTGYIDKWAEAVTYIATHSRLSASDICSLYLSSCSRRHLPIDLSLNLPDPPGPQVSALRQRRYPTPSTPGLQVLHFADIHLDLKYAEGADNACDDVLCCRAQNGFPEEERRRAGRWGEYRQCDAPFPLVESALQHAAEHYKGGIDYILWTGDNTPHDIWRSTREEVIEVNSNITSLFLKRFPGVPVIPVIGNHDSVPNDGFPPPEAWSDGFSLAWLYSKLAHIWKPWLTADATATLERNGYYSLLLKPGFRILVLNTNVAYKLNFWVLMTAQRDPYRHLQWLTEELQAAQMSGESVHIVGHISPGDPDVLPAWSHLYHQIIQSYQDTVKAQFFSHTHRDEVLLSKDERNQAFSVQYVAPSLTPFTNKNPGYKMYTIDGARGSDSTWEVTEVARWTADLAEANARPELGPRWLQQHKVSEAYHLPSLSPQNWSRFVDSLLLDDKVFTQYYRHLSGVSAVQDSCDTKCRHETVCNILWSDRSSSLQCDLAGATLRAGAPPGQTLPRRPAEP